MAGWIFQEPSWRSFLASGSQMKANTAFCLMLLAAALALRTLKPASPRGRIAANVAALFVGAIASLTLAEYWLGADLGIDQLIFRDDSTIGTSNPGRMSPPSTVSFLFGALAVLSLERETRQGLRFAQLLALGMAFVPAHILTSYAYGNMNVLAFGSRTSYMAVPTALALISIAFSVLAFAPNRGLMRALTASTQASRVFRRLLVALLVTPPFLGWFVLRMLDGRNAPPEFGVGTTVMLSIVFLAALAWFNAARLNRTELHLEKARHEAERANRAKDQFLAMLSHELRTPLNPVLLAASALEADSSLPADAREQLAMMRRNIELEARLIDDLLDVTRIAHGKLELHREVIDLHAAIEHALGMSAFDIETRKLTVLKHLDAANHHANADAARLQEVFWNILRNAVKFTPHGGQIEISTQNDDTGRIVIQFTDTGIGIESHLQSRIFDAFEQGDPGTQTRYGGLGLGLAISKRIIDLHHGSIEVRSAGRGGGSTFVVKLNTVETSRVSVATSAPRRSVAAPASAELLIVEDHEDTLRVLQRILRNAGYGVSACRTVVEARALAAERKFDLVISDIGLPDGDGLELMRSLRETHGLTGIALSGFGTEEDLSASKAAGFVAHLTKPVDLERLRVAINLALNGSAL
jgi:signal transduction histidine kinase/CheY-like chemotaxis protein